MRRRLLIGILLVLGFANAVGAQFNATPLPNVLADGNGALTGAMIIGSGAYVMDGVLRTMKWRNTAATNPSGRALKIKKITIWTGVDAGAKADVGTFVTRESDNNFVHHQGWDHYADPTGPNHGTTQDFGPSFIRLNVGDALVLTYWGVPFAGFAGTHADHFVMIWAEYAAN